MVPEILMRLIMVFFDCRFLQSAVHSLDLAVCPGVVRLGQPVLDAMLVADPVEQVNAVSRGRAGAVPGLDGSMSKAVNRDENWFGYYWSPTALIGRHKMVKLDFGVPFIGSEHWDGCIVKPEQECADPKPSSWTKSEVHTVVTADFAENVGDEVMEYLKNRVFPGDVMNGMLVYMDENQADGADAAAEFLRVHGDVWKPWVPSEVAANVKGM